MNDHWEMRLKNLLWTVSGDYSLEMSFEDDKWEETPWAALYDAVKEGAYVRYCSQTFREEVSLYLLKKIYLGAEEGTLVQAAGLCIDSMAGSRILAERPGAEMIRRRAYEELMDVRFDSLVKSDLGRLSLLWMRASLDGNALAERRLTEHLEHLKTLAKEQGIENREEDTAGEIAKQEEHGENGKAGQSENVRTFLETLDQIYNRLADPAFEKKRGGLDAVLSVTMEELQEFNWQDFLDENATEASLEEMMRQANSSTLPEDEEEAEEKKYRAGKILITEEDIKKMYSYIELHFGTSYMDAREQERLNRRICRGIHADCKLYFTEGILKGCVRENNTYVLAKRTSEMNERFYRQNQRISRHNIAALGDILKRSLQARNEDDTQISDYGTVIPQKLWKVGRTSDTKLFLKQFKKNNSDFVVDVLIDASGSQRSRQHMIALQGYILSAALTRAGIPHRVLSFCSFWDYTVMRRFREYNDPAEADWNLMEFTSSSNNRDGLALRAAADGLLARPEENRVLIVLSDGRPNDLVVNRPNAKNPAVYTGDYAVKDTASEVRRLRSQGISVLGVFAGEEQDLQAERKIFGKDFAYIRELSTFAHVVGRYLRKQLDEQD